MAWKIDHSHSEITFSVRHMMIATVRGKFTAFDGTFELNEADLAKSTGEIAIDAASIDTANEQRDNHLRSADFLDAAEHPKLTFRPTSVRAAGENQFEITGDLTIRGTAKPVTLRAEVAGPAKDPWGSRRIGISATGEIDRTAWGLEWNQALEAGGLLVANKVKLGVELELVEQA